MASSSAFTFFCPTLPLPLVTGCSSSPFLYADGKISLCTVKNLDRTIVYFKPNATTEEIALARGKTIYLTMSKFKEFVSSFLSFNSERFEVLIAPTLFQRMKFSYSSQMLSLRLEIPIQRNQERSDFRSISLVVRVDRFPKYMGTSSSLTAATVSLNSGTGVVADIPTAAPTSPLALPPTSFGGPASLSAPASKPTVVTFHRKDPSKSLNDLGGSLTEIRLNLENFENDCKLEKSYQMSAIRTFREQVKQMRLTEKKRNRRSHLFLIAISVLIIGATFAIVERLKHRS